MDAAEESNLVDLKTRTKAFALRVIRLFSALPPSTVAQVIGKQLLRSGTSVGAHYREAVRGRSDAEFVSKIEGSIAGTGGDHVLARAAGRERGLQTGASERPTSRGRGADRDTDHVRQECEGKTKCLILAGVFLFPHSSFILHPFCMGVLRDLAPHNLIFFALAALDRVRLRVHQRLPRYGQRGHHGHLHPHAQEWGSSCWC